MVNVLKKVFSASAPTEHFKANQKFLKKMIRYSKKNKKGKTARDVIFKSKSFFMESNNKHTETRNIIYNIISNNNDLYNVKTFI